MFKEHKAEAVFAGVVGIALAFIVNHFVELASTALVQTMGAQIRYARAELWHSFLPGNPAFFVLGTTDTALLTGGVAALLVVAAYLIYVFKGNFRKGEEHGSARFSTKQEIAAFADREVPTNNVVLAQDFRLQAHGSPDYEHSRNRNVLVIGGSGAGKTFGYLKPNLMQIAARENETAGCTVADMDWHARSFFVTDSKGTTSVDTGFLLAEHGYVVKMFNVVDMWNSLHFNPFKYITDLVDCMSFATCLVANTTGSNDPNREDFWEKAEKLLFNCVGTYMLTELPAEDRNLVTFCRLVDLAMVSDAGDMSPLDRIFYELEHGVRRVTGRKKEGLGEDARMWRKAAGASSEWEQVCAPQPNHPAVLAYKDFLSGARETKQSILISAKTRLTPLRAEQVQELLRYDEMEIDKIGERKTIIYCVFDGQDPTYNFLIAIMTWTMLKQLFTRCATKYAFTNRGELPVGVDFLLDEAANFYIPDLEKTIAQCRSYNIGITLLLQSKAQLKSRYGDDAETIIDCCDSLVFLGGKSTETNKMLEEMISQETVTTENRSSNSAQKGVNKSLALHGRALMQAPEIAKMSKLECLVLVTGCNPWKGPKTKPDQMPLWNYANPGHKGSRFKRGFDFAAYRTNRRYYDFETTVEASVEMSTSESFGLALSGEESSQTVEYSVRLVNTGDAPAYNICFSTEVSITNESNESAIVAGRRAPFPYFSDEAYNRHWMIEQAVTSKKDIGEDEDILEVLDGLGQFSFQGLNLEAGESVVVTIAYGIPLTEMRDAFARSVAGAERCDFRFTFEPSVRVANADVELAPRSDVVRFARGTRGAEIIGRGYEASERRRRSMELEAEKKESEDADEYDRRYAA